MTTSLRAGTSVAYRAWAGPRAVTHRATPTGARWWAVLGVVAVTAFTVRLGLAVHGGGLGGLFGYDDGVYFSAATGLVWGRVPYRDFILLHPPGVLWALSPFALLGRATHDSWGLEAARVAWMLLGALNATLVVRAARRWGLLPAAAGGMFYALWTPVAATEVVNRLEPLVSFGLLVAIVLLSRPRSAIGTGTLLLAGAGLGFALCVKIWAVAAVAVVLVWAWQRLGARAGLRVLAGSVGTATALCLPFFHAAPDAMFRMVIWDQLGRGRTAAPTLSRLGGMLGLFPSAHGPLVPVVAWSVAAVVVVLVGAGVLHGGARGTFVGALLVVQVGVLLVAPSYFGFYAAFLGPALALGFAGGVAVWLARARTSGRASPLAPALVLTVAGLVLVDASTVVGRPFPAEQLAHLEAASRCVTADSPGGLVLTDVLGRDLARGCPVMVDVTGLTYDRDALPLLADGHAVPREANGAWQRDLLGYLLAGDTILLLRPAADGFNRASWVRLHQRIVLAATRDYVLLGGPDVRPLPPLVTAAPRRAIWALAAP